MMAISLQIPVYAGGYRMDADALQVEMIELRDCIVSAVLTEDERLEIQDRCQHRGRWSFDQINEAQIARVQELLSERLDRKDRYNWTVAELIEKFSELRSKMEREHGMVR